MPFIFHLREVFRATSPNHQVRKPKRTRTMLKSPIKAAILAATLINLPATAFAHGFDEPQQGGIVSTAGDLGFELLSASDGVFIFVMDHGKPYDTAGITGKITVLNGAEKGEAEILATGTNKLEAKGVSVEADGRAVATLTMANGDTLTVRFSAPLTVP